MDGSPHQKQRSDLKAKSPLKGICKNFNNPKLKADSGVHTYDTKGEVITLTFIPSLKPFSCDLLKWIHNHGTVVFKLRIHPVVQKLRSKIRTISQVAYLQQVHFQISPWGQVAGMRIRLAVLCKGGHGHSG